MPDLGTADVRVNVRVDSKDASKGIRDTDTAIGGLGRSLKGLAIGGGIAAAGAAVVSFGADVVRSASEAEQSLGAVNAIFGTTADQIIANSQRAATEVGLSGTQYQNLAAQFGASLGNMGVAADQLAPQTDKLVSLGADLAAQFGGSTSEAVDTISSLFRGAGDPIEKFGVSIRQSDVNARLLEKGLTGLTGEAQKNAELTARMELLYEQTAAAQGAFSRESDTLAGKQARVTAQFDNFKTRLGSAVMPIVNKFFGVLADSLLPALEDLLPVIVGLIELMADRLTPVIDIVSGVIEVLAGLLTGDFEQAWEGAKGIIGGFVDFVRTTFNQLISIWNALDFSISWNPPAWLQKLGVGPINVGDIFPDIPYLASGGIVRRPTLAMIGEAGPEAVVPLSSGAGMGATYHIHIAPAVGQHPAEVGRAVVEAIRDYEQVAGTSWRRSA